MEIVQISDIHIGGNYFVKEWGENVLKFTNSIKPDILVVSGDITDEGFAHQYEEAKNYLNKFEVNNKIIIPGNHDARNGGFTIFEEVFGTRYPVYKNEKLIILGVDSSVPDLDDGRVGRGNYNYIAENLYSTSIIKILVLHHHLIPIPGTGRERHIPEDAGDVLKLCVELNMDFVLSGHKHLPWMWKLENTYFITAGTATTRRLKGRGHPSFNIIKVNDREITIEEMNVIDRSLKKILRSKIG